MRRGVSRRKRVRWPRLLRGRRRTGLAIAVACLVVAGGALAAVRWTTADVPAGGRGVYAFALPRTDILPGGYARTRPPRISELPMRPALLFPAGTSYATAIRDYYAVRERRGIVPAGVTLTDPLPGGKVVRVLEDGRIALDPAAPVGYDLWTGLVSGLLRAPDGTFAPSLPRCQVILPSDDPSAPADCLGNPNRAPYVRAEGERWVASPTPVTPPTQIVGTTDLSVLARARTSEDVLPAPLRWRSASMRGHELQPDDARLALRTGGLRV
ncbi:MAG: hypothetical protein QOK40_1252, partial [Miltoncostaeaceae bacterium]|nr:hypothetical protein [Miltoncostaeaceae bacterium]